MKIIFTKEFEQQGKKYEKGLVAEVPQDGADSLIEMGYAQKYVAMEGDTIVAVKETDGAESKHIDQIVKSILQEQAKSDPKLEKQRQFEEDSYIKTAGYKHIAEFAQDVYKSKHGMSDRLKKWVGVCEKAAGDGLVTNVDTDGGFLIPVEYRNQLMKDSLEASIVKPRATVIPMMSNQVKIPTVKDTSRESNYYGGVVIYRPDEVGVKTSSKPEFEQVKLELKKLVGLCYVSDEMLEDSPISVAPLLSTMFSEAIAFTEDNDFVNGDGAGKALGVLNAPCLVTVAKETSQDNDTIVTQNILKMYSRLKPRSAQNAIWIASPDTFPQLASLTMNVGTGGSHVGLVQTMAGSAQMSLLGRPLILTEHAAKLGDKGDIILADWRQYLVGEKTTGVQVASSIHLKFDYDQTAFRFVKRYDGQPWESSARTPKNGGATLSSFITLAAR
jgi:HK97 family phage major capsid protein